MKSKTYDITPDIKLLIDIGEANYEVPQAISELIANSMDARKDDELITVWVEITDDYISILDNGIGMDEQTLGEALRLGTQHRPPTRSEKARKGMYGLGLKAACASLGKFWQITTRPENDSNEYFVEIDLDEWLRKTDRSSWSIQVHTRAHQPGVGRWGKVTHGTEIRVSKLKQNFEMAASVAVKLGMAYKPHLENGDGIIVNDSPVPPMKFDLVDDRTFDIDVEIAGYRVTGWAGIDKKTHNDGSYGINIYRQGQLVEPWNKDFIRKHLMSSRVVGEIDLPFVSANFHKLGFNKTSEEWQLVKKYMTEYLRPLVRASGEMAQGKNDETRKARAMRGLEQAFGAISGRYPDPGDQDTVDDSEDKDGVAKPNTPAVSFGANTLVIGDITLKISSVFEDLEDETIPWDFIPGEGEVQAVINTSSPLYLQVKDTEFIAMLALSEAVMSFGIKRLGFTYEKAKEIRDGWLFSALQRNTQDIGP